MAKKPTLKDATESLRKIAEEAFEKKMKPKVEMISYSIKMVIPTGQYANIQPEIVVNAGSPEEAHDFIAPHMNKLWKEYFMVNERRPEPVVHTKFPPEAPENCPHGKLRGYQCATCLQTPNQMPPASSVAFTKASQAIASCLSVDALDLITEQVKKSTKLTDPDKDKLMVLVIGKIKEFNGDPNAKK
jgi:hypothetical protein